MEQGNTDGRFKPIMGGYVPFRALWEDAEGALFASAQSARWFVHVHRARLLEANAMALHVGRLIVHKQRFEGLAEAIALERAKASLPREVPD